MNKLHFVLDTLAREKLLVFIYLLAFAIRFILAIPLAHDWDGYVFSDSAKNLLHGITPYKTVEQNDPSIYPDSDRIMTEQWYGYPPLPLLMFTTTYAIPKYIGI